MASLVFRSTSFSYPGSPVDLFQSIDFGVSEGWVGVIGSNGAGKTTLLQLACGHLVPQQGQIHRPASIVYCPQRTDEPMPEFSDFLSATDGDAYRIRGALEVEDDYFARWNTLSHGERKRAQIATCLYLEPELLAVDEPTNHLDAEARERVAEALRRYRGIGLLVSHDRTLLDTLCAHSLFVAPPTVALRGGGYTTAMKELEHEAEAAREARTSARKERRRLEHEAVVRREHLHKAEKKKSLRGMNPRDSDARAKAYAARNADSGVRKRVRQIDGRVHRAEANEHSIRVTPQRSLGIGIHGKASRRNRLLAVAGSSLPLGDTRTLRFPDLLMQPRDRIALVGANGSGKSTLLQHIEEQATVQDRTTVWIPQEITADESARTLRQVRSLRGEELGAVMSWVSLLGSNPAQLLDSELPSPGEIRKLMLALRLEDTPTLVVMDEPTNHMDLPSIECLEAALKEYEGGLLLVSHDQVFLSRLTTLRWEIKCRSPHDCQLVVHSHWSPDVNLSHPAPH